MIIRSVGNRDGKSIVVETEIDDAEIARRNTAAKAKIAARRPPTPPSP